MGRKISYQKHKLAQGREDCPSCGGQLVQKDPYTFRCTSCGREFYLSVNRTHKISFHLSMGKTILACTMAAVVIIALAVFGYQYYTGRLVSSARRFSVAFRDFVMEVYGKPAAEISKEDLGRIKYLKIEKAEGGYSFTYGFEDSFRYPDMGRYQDTLRSVTVKASKDEFSPSNIQYFPGLTRLELYVDGWENYTLPEENVLRCIYCTDGLSRYGTPQFFTRVNRETLEEVKILEAENLEDFSFLSDLRGIKRFSLENAVIADKHLLDGFAELEELSLLYVEMDEEDAYGIVKGFLELPSLNRFAIEGKSAWYLTDGQWEELEQAYGGKVRMTRN